MPTLTIEAIRKNPWTVVTHSLPAHPTPLLLAAAHLAAHYCRQSEYVLMEAARDRNYVPPAWQPGSDSPDVHEINEARSLKADRKLDEISELWQREFGEIMDR
jgi:hypothetical protein